MTVLRTVDEVRSHRASAGRSVLVPTMGAFHEGHLELMRRAKALGDTVYVSLFVNPTQFGPGEDLSKYPRDEAKDVALAESAGADVVFAPSVEEVYAGPPVVVSVGEVSELWEGAHRPGHFDGVATVVTKLFNIFSPDVAVFGLKDLQQCAVVRSLVDGLKLPIQLDFVETVRDENGLALSSRNKYLSDEERARASAFCVTLTRAAERIKSGGGREATDEAAKTLGSLGFEVEYVSCVDPVTMQECYGTESDRRVIGAARFCTVRLIDNVPV